MENRENKKFEKLYTVNEIIEILRISRMTIYRYLKSGKIKSVKIAGQHRISESELEKFLDNAGFENIIKTKEE